MKTSWEERPHFGVLLGNSHLKKLILNFVPEEGKKRKEKKQNLGVQTGSSYLKSRVSSLTLAKITKATCSIAFTLKNRLC